jgi:hypothetical protein
VVQVKKNHLDTSNVGQNVDMFIALKPQETGIYASQKNTNQLVHIQ